VSQQINLYRPIFRRQEKKFSARAMAQAGAAIVLGVVALYGFMWWQLNDMHRTLRGVEQQQVAATAQLLETARRLGTDAPSAQTVVDPVTRLEREVAELRRVEQALGRDRFVSSGGYSDFFVALARQPMAGLWLTGITISEAGANLTLAGRTTDAVNVPRYLQRLGTEKTLAGKEFEVFVLSRDKDEAELEFSLKTAPDKDDKQAKRS
jgi:Tfp pilus assembly protein PilN